MKEIKCILLKVDTVLITEVNQIESTLGEPDCELINPYEINVDGELSPWPEVAESKRMRIHSDSILTIVDPKADIIAKYNELTS